MHPDLTCCVQAMEAPATKAAGSKHRARRPGPLRPVSANGASCGAAGSSKRAVAASAAQTDAQRMAAEDAKVVAHGPELAGDGATRGGGGGSVRGNSAGKRRRVETAHLTTGRRLAATAFAAEVGAARRLGSDGNFDVPCLLVGVVMSVLHRFFSSGDGWVSVHRFHSLMAVELQAGGAELALAADDDGDSVAVCNELQHRGHVWLHEREMAFEDYYSEGEPPLPHFED